MLCRLQEDEMIQREEATAGLASPYQASHHRLTWSHSFYKTAHFKLHTARYTLHIAYVTMHTSDCELYSLRHTLYTVRLTLYTEQCIPYTMYCTLPTVKCSLNGKQGPICKKKIWPIQTLQTIKTVADCQTVGDSEYSFRLIQEL